MNKDYIFRHTMIKIISNLFFLFVFSSVFGQNDSLILTSQQNNNWLHIIKGLPLDKQLTAINKRLLLNTNIFVREFFPDGIKIKNSVGKRVCGAGKPEIIIGTDLITIDNNTNSSKIVELTKLISENTIKEIKILDGDDQYTLALYGTSGLNGIIIMTPTKNKYSKRFRQINSELNK